MGLMRCQKDGKQGWKWDPPGTCYLGEGGRARALAVGRAVWASRHARGKAEDGPADELSQAEVEQRVAAMSDDDLAHVLSQLEPHPSEAVELGLQVRKADEEKRLVWAEVYIPDLPDVDDEFMTRAEVEKMAHDFLLRGNTRAVDVQHDNEARDGVWVAESFVARKGDPEFIEGAWVVALKVLDDVVWKGIKNGELNGLSMQARVRLQERVVELDIPPEVRGATQIASTGDLHRHGYAIKFDDYGQFLGGRTDSAKMAVGDGPAHWHRIVHRTLTGPALGPDGRELPEAHVHRYTLMDRLAGRTLEESPGYGEPGEGFVAVQTEGFA